MERKKPAVWKCPHCEQSLANVPDGSLRVAADFARFCISGGRIIAACNKCGEVSEYRPQAVQRPQDKISDASVQLSHDGSSYSDEGTS